MRSVVVREHRESAHENIGNAFFRCAMLYLVMPFAPVNGIDLYYEVNGSGPALLFAHGQGGNHLSWWQQVPFFSRFYTCITFDNRAFGFSLDRDGRGRTAF